MSAMITFRCLLGKPTVDDWCDRLTQCPHRDNLLQCLLSDMPLADKSIMLDKYLTATANKSTDPSKSNKSNELNEPKETLLWLESKLTDANNASLAQVIRCMLFFSHQPQTDIKNDMKWSRLMIRADIEARWVVQRESYLHEEIRALRKTSSLQPLVPHPRLHVPSPLAAEEKPRLSAYEAELRHLDTQYTEHKLYMWFLEGGKPLSALGRAFETCREDPNRYLSKWLRRVCAGHWGVLWSCGWSCGCCERPRETLRWEWKRGHCVSACGCCVHACGVVKGVEVKRKRKGKLDDDLKMPASITGPYKTMYNARMHFAYIWGFDLLDGVDGR